MAILLNLKYKKKIKSMTMTAMQLEDELRIIHKTMDELIAAGTSFFVAKVAMINQFHITMGEAEDRLRLYESITNKQLPR